MCWARKRSRSGCSMFSASNSPVNSRCRPRARSASMRASSAASRSSRRPRYLGLEDGAAVDVGIGVSAPHGQSVPKCRRRRVRVGLDHRERRSNLVLEPDGVDRLSPDHERVATGRLLDDVTEFPTNHGDEGLDRATGSLGSLLAVDVLDDPVDADGVAHISNEQRQDAALLGTSDRHRFALVPYLDGTKDQQVHLRTIRLRFETRAFETSRRIRHNQHPRSSVSKTSQRHQLTWL